MKAPDGSTTGGRQEAPPRWRPEEGAPDTGWRRLLTDRVPDASLPVSGMALLALLLAAPLGLALLLPGTAQERLHGAGHMALLLQNVAVLGAAVVLRYEWQQSRRPGSGWLSAAVGFLAVQNLPFTLLLVAGSPLGEFGTVNGVATTVTGVLTVLLLWLGARGVPVRGVNPLVLGVSLGAALAGLRLAAAHEGLDPTLDLSEPTLVALDLVAAAAGVGAITALLHCSDLPLWFRRYSVIATVLLTLSASPVVMDAGLSWLMAPMMGEAGVVLLLGGAIGLMRATLRRQTRQLVDLTRFAAKAEASVRHGRERQHELNATVTGIAHASRLLLMDQGVGASERRRLSALIDVEMDRLHRMLSGRAGPATPALEAIPLDALVEPLVAVQGLLGHEVDFRPTGLEVWGSFDDLAEALHILLTNAGRHAPGAHVTVEAEQRGDLVALRVHDDGPGISPDLTGRLFRWGSRGHDSPGEGIGLSLARRLVWDMGGDLRAEPVARGTTFLIELPGAPSATAVTDAEDPAASRGSGG